MSNSDEALDYGRAVFLDESFLNSEIATLRTNIRERATVAGSGTPSDLMPGISIIVATHRGADRIGSLLKSLTRQSLSFSEFEVIVIENGEVDATEQLVRAASLGYPSLRLRYFWSPVPSAGAARNLGIQLAQRSFITFVDDDDALEPDFLADALSESGEDNIVVSPIVNVHGDGTLDATNPLNQKIAQLRGRVTSLEESPWILGFNACKLVPTQMIRDLRYEESLVSGEDLVFWAQLLQHPNIEVRVAPSIAGNAYLRGLRDESISRQGMTRNFAVSQRVACIAALQKMRVGIGSPQAGARDALSRAQAGFISRYLDQNHLERQSVVDEITEAGIVNFPWQVLNKGLGRDLAFVYCFAPFSDTSAVVAAKAIAERERVVDVVTNDMSSVRKLDPAVSALADQWIDQRAIIPSKPAFSDWALITEFATRAVSVAEKNHALKGGYEEMYSRALWVGSHVAGALFKLRHWAIEWTAEFSDPLRRDAEGRPRQGKLNGDDIERKLANAISARGFDGTQYETLFDLVEMATFVLADKLIFTNENQMQYMLSLVPDTNLKQLVQQKAIVRPHPAPPEKAYYVQKSDYEVPQGVVNIAYFGSFYPNRGIGDVIQALAHASADVRRQIRLHVFSNKPDTVAEAAKFAGVSLNVYSNGYLPYMQFLNSTKKFDVLLVNDVERGDGLPINPFLPSKVSDYRGSNTPIWAIVDEGSPMSQMEFAFKSPVGNVPQILRAIEDIARHREA